jgi:hypothetical protein
MHTAYPLVVFGVGAVAGLLMPHIVGPALLVFLAHLASKAVLSVLSCVFKYFMKDFVFPAICSVITNTFRNRAPDTSFLAHLFDAVGIAAGLKLSNSWDGSMFMKWINIQLFNERQCAAGLDVTAFSRDATRGLYDVIQLTGYFAPDFYSRLQAKYESVHKPFAAALNDFMKSADPYNTKAYVASGNEHEIIIRPGNRTFGDDYGQGFGVSRKYQLESEKWSRNPRAPQWNCYRHCFQCTGFQMPGTPGNQVLNDCCDHLMGQHHPDYFPDLAEDPKATGCCYRGECPLPQR